MKPSSKIYIVILFYTTTVLVSCHRNDENGPLYTLKMDGKEILHVDFRNVTDTITIKLSDIVEDVKFIQLETNEESMLKASGLLPGLLNKGTILVGEKNIIVLDPSRGLFQFSIGGKFIRKIVSPGRGPCEFGYPIYTLDETGEGKLIISDPTHPKSIMQFNLTTGECLESIPSVFSGNIDNILVIGSSILCAPQIGPSNAGEFYLFSQNFNGKLISSVKHQTKQVRSNSRADVLYRIQDRIYFRPDLYDTIFQYEHGEIKPTLVIKARNRKDELLKEDFEGNIRVSIATDTDFHTILSADEITKAQGKSITLSGIKSVLIDKENRRAFKINSIVNDIFPYWLTPDGTAYPYVNERILRSNPDNNMYYVFTGYEFKSISTTIQKASEIEMDPDVRNQIIKIDSTLTIDGNPVIMIAKAKSMSPIR